MNQRPTAWLRSGVLLVLLLGSLLCAGLAGLPQPTAHGQAARDETLAVIVNRAVPVRSLSAYELEAIFTQVQRDWPSGGGRILVFNHPPGTAARTFFDRVVLRMDADQVGRFWIDKRVRGAGLPPRVVSSSAILVRIVASLAGAVGYVPRAELTPEVRVVAWISGGKVLAP